METATITRVLSRARAHIVSCALKIWKNVRWIMVSAVTFWIVADLRHVLPIIRQQMLSQFKTTIEWVKSNSATEIVAATGLVVVLLAWSALMRCVKSLRKLPALLSAISLVVLFGAITSLIIFDIGSLYYALVGAAWAGLIIAATSFQESHVSSLPGLDAPLENECNDTFERTNIVTRVLAQVTQSTIRCPRTALIAPVGYGKTTVANFVGKRAAEQGHLFVRFDPWHHHMSEDVRSALVATIDDALSHCSGRTHTFAGFRHWLMKLSRGAVEDQKWANALLAPVEARLKIGQDELARAIADALPPGSRVIIFVDDLERCSAATALDMLMQAREIFDVTGLAYIFAFDRVRLQQKLEAANLISQGDLSVLDKVFDYRVELPPPAADKLRLLRAELGKIHNLSTDTLATLDTLSDLLPAAPRDTKRFLTMVGAWPQSIDKPSKTLSQSYLILLLLLEYYSPSSIAWISKQSEWIDDLDQGVIREGFRVRAGLPAISKDTDDDSRMTKAPWSNVPEAVAVHSRARLSSTFNARGHIAWILGQWNSTEEQLAEQIRRGLESGSATGIELLRKIDGYGQTIDADALYAALLRVGNERGAEMKGQPLRRDELKLHGELRTIAEAREVCVTDAAKAGSRIAPHLVKDTLSSFCEWVGWGGLYADVLQREWVVLESLSNHAGKSAIEYLVALDLRVTRFDPNGGASSAVNRLKRRLMPLASEIVLERFSVPGYCRSLVRRSPESQVEDELLLSLELFDDPLVCEKFYRMMDASVPGDAVWCNVFDFLQRLMDRAMERDSLAARVARRRELMEAMWRCVTREPLNETYVVILEGYRRWLIDNVSSADAFPLPGWWGSVSRSSRTRWTGDADVEYSAGRILPNASVVSASGDVKRVSASEGEQDRDADGEHEA
ncbi:P-loop NTPase fold protein [Sorangium sp. So ce834]|uniref:P-loop NTPase fold protein n=1 Tax=Sorangium sp. So ce834 TaxID=3133321 RepID=UPI003F5F8BAA